MKHPILFLGLALASPAAAQGLGLRAVGPVNPDHGFPQWYEDTNGIRLDLCLENTALCVLGGAATMIDPSLPFPDNYGGTFPDEAVYSLAEASLPTNNGGQALLIMALEAAFPNTIVDGDQMVFARMRIRVDNLVAGETYEVTTPFGTYSFIAQNSTFRGIDFTDDVGLVPGLFTEALGTDKLGPFLMWDDDLPIVDAQGRQYLGDPNIPHTITGSPYGTNFFRIRGRDVGGPGINEIQTDLFSVAGLLSEAYVPPPPGPLEITLAPARAGEMNRLRVTGGTEGGLMIFIYGFRPRPNGFRLVGPFCPGTTLDIRDPIPLGFGTTFLGSTSMSAIVPLQLFNQRMVFQALDLPSCLTSEAIQVRFQ